MLSGAAGFTFRQKALLAVRGDGGVVWSSDGAPLAHPHPVSCTLGLLYRFIFYMCLQFFKFSHFALCSKK